MRKRWLWLLSGGLLAVVISPVPADEMTEKRIRSGRSIYQLTCSVCHGDKGDGKTWTTRALDPPPKDFTSEPDHFNMEELVEHISEGCHDTAMQPFKYQLYEEEIEEVSAHILVNLLGWTVADVNADMKGALHAGGDHGSHDHHASHDHKDSHAGEGACKPWNLEGVRTVAVKGRRR